MVRKPDGKDVLSYLLDDSVIIESTSTDPTIKKGHLYAVLAYAESGSVLPGTVVEEGGVQVFVPALEIGKCFFNTDSNKTLAAGDKVVELGTMLDDAKLIGYANSKDFTESKSTFDNSVDEDGADGDQGVSPMVSVSGNINGLRLNGKPLSSAVRIIDAKFADQIITSASGTTSVLKQNSDPELVAFVYGRPDGLGNDFDVKIVPVNFSSNGNSSAYNSATSKSVAWVATVKSRNGVKRCDVTATLAD